MAVLVQKFGGTSVGSVDRIENVAKKIIGYRDAGHSVVVVVSAMSGETNRLLALAKDIMGDAPHGQELDVLLSTGEQVTIALLSMALQKRGCRAISRTGWQLDIKTDDARNKARITSIDAARIKKHLEAGLSWWSPDFRVLMTRAILQPWAAVDRIPLQWHWRLQ